MNNDYMEKQWFKVLKEEVERSSQRLAAEKFGVSLTTVSLIMNGKYQAKTDKVADRVMQVYTNVECPYTGSVMTLKDCREQAASQAPTHNPIKMQHWRACQNYPKRNA